MRRCKTSAGAAVLAALFLTQPTAAQTTWIVDRQNRAGAHFTTLPAAVAAASTGDTLLVRGVDPLFYGSYSGFRTSKGLTIVGVSMGSHRAFLTSSDTSPVRVSSLPASAAFSLVGFEVYPERSLHVQVDQCAGHVHLQDLVMVEPGLGPQPHPSVVITGSRFVTLHQVQLFGGGIPFTGPSFAAVEASNSHVVITDAALGVTPRLGLGSGECLSATDAVVEVVAPRFEAIGTGTAITALRSRVLLAGHPGSYVRGAPPVHGTGGELLLDPQVQLQPTSGGAVVTGTVAVRGRPSVSVVADRALAGGSAVFTSSAPAGALVVVTLGLPAPPSPVLGCSLLVSPAGLVTLSLSIMGPGVIQSLTVAVPASVPPGTTLVSQGAMLVGGRPSLGPGCAFAVR